jgi:hypothetical protein
MMEFARDPPNAVRLYADYPFADDDLWIDLARTGNVQIARRKGIRARVVGKDITDRSRWVSLETLNCNEVWMSGANIRLRENQDQETFDATFENHRAN